ncbi:MAG: hypothetical protein J6D54_05515 [Olsenella sp.]|nr:hypothetical protein [Olsenella sp.]
MKGHAEIILTDVETGEVSTYHEDNIVTNAVQDLIRLNPAGLNFSGIPWGLPICPNAIGGVLLFGEEIEEDAAKYYAPTDAIPVGYASNGADTSSDPKRGSYNANESYRTDNGYRLVFDFGTSDACGEIKCVCLTSSDGGRAYFGSRYQSDPCWYKSIYSNYWDVDDSLGLDAQYESMRALDGSYAYGARNLSAYGIEWNRWKKHVNDLPLGQGNGIVQATLETTNLYTDGYFNPSGYTNQQGELSPTYDRTLYPTYFSDRAGSAWDECDYYRWYWVAGTGSIRLCRVRNGTLSEWAMEYSGVTLAKASLATIAGGYIYAWKSDGKGVYKLHLTDPTDVTLIPLPSGTGQGSEMRAISSPFNGDGPLYVTWRYTVGSAYTDYAALIFDTVMERTYYGYSWGYAWNSSGYMGRCLRVGPYALRTYRYSNGDYGWQLLVVAPYLATINNLATPIQKTVTQTMKIVYTLTEE